MTTNELIDRLIRIKDGLTQREDRDAINEACERLKLADELALFELHKLSEEK